jgi:curved DNA-binding protein
VAVKFRDYYEVLGVSRDASGDAIKRAYRQLARKHHPDLKPASERAQATERFKEINEAYEVLSDPEKRKKYDALGEQWKNGMDFTPPPGAERGGGWTQGGGPSVQWEEFGDLGGFSDFFSSLFGERGPRGDRAGRMSFQGSHVEAELPVSVEDLLAGGTRRITLQGDRHLEVRIPPGAREGTVLRLTGQGEAGSGADAARGDLFLRLRLTPHPRARVAGDDIEMNLPIWPWQAVLGAELRVETLDGAVRLRVPAGTQSGQRLRLRGRGLPRPDGTRGDLDVIVRVVVPDRPTAEERQAYEALKQAASAPSDRPAEGSAR